MIQRIFMLMIALTAFRAEANVDVLQIIDVNQMQAIAMDEARVQALPWKVGESADYSVNMGFVKGTNQMLVREEVFEGFWVEQNMDLGFLGKNKIEILFDKNDGSILQLLVNGEKQEIPDSSGQEIEEMKEATVTVPAGTFDCIYAKIRDTKENKTSEAWINPSEIPISGMVKQVAPGPLGTITMELTSFLKK